ncbi:MAG: hypothetical protein ACR2KK_01685 [Acidimicrobiales bacterium]
MPITAILAIASTLATASPASAATYPSLGMVTGRKYTAGDSATPLTQRQLQDMKNMGVATVRVEFEDVQGARTDRVQAYHNILQWSSSLNLKVIGVLGQWSTPNPNFAPSQTSSKADFENRYLPMYLDAVRWHERTYGAHASLEGWEIFNEPDVPQYGWFRGDTFMKDEIAVTNVRVWEWIKARGELAAQRKVIMTAMSHTDSHRWMEMFNTDTMYWFRQNNGGDIPADVVAMHGYGRGWDPRSATYSVYGPIGGYPGNFEGQLVRFFGYRDRGGREIVPANKTVYVTEFGVDSKQTSLASVASSIKFYLDTMSKFPRITKAFLYNYRDDETPPDFTAGPTAYGVRRISKDQNGGIKAEPYNMLRNLTGQAGVGQTAGFSAPVPAFATAFNRVDGSQNLLGAPADNGGGPYVHSWGNGVVQDFKGALYSATGRAMITRETGVAEAAVVYGRFYDTWMNNNGAPGVGYPFNNGGGVDRHPWDSAKGTGFVQDLRKDGRHNAMLTFETSPGRVDAVFIITQPILGKYMALGGVSAYGYPRSAAYWNGATWCQNFGGGTICA